MNYLYYTRMASSLKNRPFLNRVSDSNNNNSNATVSSRRGKIAILVHGAFQSPETFSVGGQSSLRWHLCEQGYEVWDLSTEGLEGAASAESAGPETGSVQSRLNMRDVYKRMYVESRGGMLPSVTWIAFSTACHDLLLALRRADTEEAAGFTLSRGAEPKRVVLLSPITARMDGEAGQSGQKSAHEAGSRREGWGDIAG
jgi:hypothetical protein